eukprot:scaffold249274_cov31-Tisochrysis_lutea.AAC.2
MDATRLRLRVAASRPQPAARAPVRTPRDARRAPPGWYRIKASRLCCKNLRHGICTWARLWGPP